jgi:methanogenic corrinoid protein MtbC1
MTMTVPGEEHTLAIELISNYFKQEGIESYCFGSNMPIHSLLENIKEIKPDCLVLSMTLKKHTNNLLMFLDYLYEFYPKLPIVIGGQGVDELDTIQFKQAVKLINSLDGLKDSILDEGSENHE